MTAAATPRDPGLQPERTSLAWTRTSLAVLANGGVLLVKEFPHYSRPLPLVEAGLATVIAAITYVVGLRRQRTLARRPLPDRITPRREVTLIGALVLALVVLIAIGLYS